MSISQGCNTLYNDILKSLYPIGSVYMSFNNSLPDSLKNIGTWELVSAGYFLKTITSGTGGSTANAGNTGSTTLTVDQIPSHSHGTSTFSGIYSSNFTASNTNNAAGLVWNNKTNGSGAAGGGKSHTHTAGNPASISIYMWRRKE